MIQGDAGRVLEVDLRTRRFAFQPLDEETARFYTAVADGDGVAFVKAAAGG